MDWGCSSEVEYLPSIYGVSIQSQAPQNIKVKV
jgi:hypothetical protein